MGDAYNFFDIGRGHNSGGADTLAGGNGDDFLVGDAIIFSEMGTASGGDDYLDGGDGNDAIVGDALTADPFPRGWIRAERWRRHPDRRQRR